MAMATAVALSSATLWPAASLAQRSGGASRRGSKAGQVVVDIVGLHSDKGRVLVALFCSKAGFPGDIERACAREVSAAKGRSVRVVFDGVPAGEFAVSMFHDENANSRLDRNFLGIPKEGWGTSRDAKAHFGPPSYDDARMTLAPGERKRVVVHVQY